MPARTDGTSDPSGGFPGFPAIVNVTPNLAGVRRLFLDTNPVIYYVENNPGFSTACREVMEAIDRGDAMGVTSVITLAEVLVYPLRQGDTTLADAYRALLSALSVPLVPITESVAERVADLRSRYSLKTPDALQIAAAILSGCDGFLTADAKLQRVTEPGLQVYVLQAAVIP